jgi:hypothetical protein
MMKLWNPKVLPTISLGPAAPENEEEDMYRTAAKG